MMDNACEAVVLTGPVGVVQVVTVWLEEPGRPGVRLVTVQPR